MAMVTYLGPFLCLHFQQVQACWELGHIRHDHRYQRMLAELSGNGCGQDSAQDALGSFEQLVEPDRLQLRFQTLVEVEERVRHFHATVAGALRLEKAFVKRIVRLQRVERQAHVAEDHGQLVVEVVGDETRERAHQFQLLLFTERLFDLWLAGRIFGGHAHSATALAASRARYAPLCATTRSCLPGNELNFCEVGDRTVWPARPCIMKS
jgi:hypothetical protein